MSPTVPPPPDGPVVSALATVSDGAMAAFAAVTSACLTVATVLFNNSAARARRLERRKDVQRLEAAKTLKEALAQCEDWRARYYDELEKRIRLEAGLDRVIERNGLSANAGRSGEYPPFDPRGPLPPEVHRALDGGDPGAGPTRDSR